MTCRRCSLFNCSIDLLSFEEAVSFVMEEMKNGRGLHIVTMNPEIAAAAEKNKELSGVINSAELILPESSGISLALKLKGIEQERIPGIDFSYRLIKECAAHNYPIALIGAEQHVNDKAAENLCRAFPGLNIAYKHNGYYENEEKIVIEAAKSGAALILCALGLLKQELFINKCRKINADAVYIGIGGSFDVWAGEVKRAPALFRHSGLEWLYRTIMQPQRLKRIYKTLPLFLFHAIIDSMKDRQRKL